MKDPSGPIISEFDVTLHSWRVDWYKKGEYDIKVAVK
jgi:hypothetical protein